MGNPPEQVHVPVNSPHLPSDPAPREQSFFLDCPTIQDSAPRRTSLAFRVRRYSTIQPHTAGLNHSQEKSTAIAHSGIPSVRAAAVMRSYLWLLATSARLASADWPFGQALGYHGGEAAIVLPRQTQASAHDGANGWSPRPTDGPSLDLIRRKRVGGKTRRQDEDEDEGDDTTTWVDETTCGWAAGDDSWPYTCERGSRCNTNTDNVVACTSSGLSTNPYFTVCLNYDAYQAGACEGSVGLKTGCCTTASLAECVTFLWPGSTVKSMFGCFSERTVVTMLTAPQSVIDATSTTSSASSSTATSDPQNSDGGGSSSNTGAIIGGAVGGVGGLALIAGVVAFFMIRSRKRKNNVGSGTAYSAVAPGDTGYPGSPMQQQHPAGHPGPSPSPQTTPAGYFAPPGTGLHPNNTHTPGAGAPSAIYDPRHSYYDPSKVGEQHHHHPQHQQHQQHQQHPQHQQHQQQQYSHTPPPPQGHAPYPAPYPNPSPLPQMSELDTSAVAAGHQSNPAEIGDASTQR
ncbi:hypothetical protein N658DRAFT_501597 [Parathielavia hyrcaniae]|uniref:Uncharacterized protein n=1 Tax=Parathielavia hyrcaniae TaxID=113614 RepID=A0AAN6PTK2_9PEZI|nr:hypothetical protein N658DRAFT_501597 [Parathielavia hyrcaniae]